MHISYTMIGERDGLSKAACTPGLKGITPSRSFSRTGGEKYLSTEPPLPTGLAAAAAKEQ